MNIYLTGSVGYDFIMDFPGRFADRILPEALHTLSLSFLVDTLTRQFGGTAGNLAYTLTLLGEQPVIVAPIGKDGKDYLQFLKRNHIQTAGIRVYDDEKTSSYFGITDRDDNQIGSFYVGAMKRAGELSLGDACPDPANSLAVLGPIDPGAMVRFAAECRELGLPYLYDPAFQIASLEPQALRDAIVSCRILIGNDYEIMLIEKQLGLTHAQLLDIAGYVVTTLGAKGSRIETNGAVYSVEPAPVANASDPTGAGDAYRGGFLAGYVRGLDPLTCGRMGSIAAAYTVERSGTMTHRYTRSQFMKRYRDAYRIPFVLTPVQSEKKGAV